MISCSAETSVWLNAIQKSKDELKRKTHLLCVVFGHKFRLAFRQTGETGTSYYYCERCGVEEGCTTVSFSFDLKDGE